MVEFRPRIAWLLLHASAVLADFKMVCNSDGTLTVDIPYHVPTDIVELEYGTCNKTSTGVTISKSGTNFTVLLRSRDCDMDNKHRGNLVYNQTAHFKLGIDSGDGKTFVLATFNVDATCEYESDYTVTFDYDVAEDQYEFDEGAGLLQLPFTMNAYDRGFTKRLNATEVPKVAGTVINLGLTIDDPRFNYCNKNFVITSCSVKNDDNATYNLFDYQSTQCKNDMIELSVNYDHAKHMWQISHILFLFGGLDKSSYKLSCSVKVCDNLKAGSCIPAARACTKSLDDVSRMTSCRAGKMNPRDMAAKVDEFRRHAPPGVKYVDSWKGNPAVEDISTLMGAQPPVKPARGVYTDNSNRTRRWTLPEPGLPLADQPAAIPESYSLGDDADCGEFSSVAREQGICGTCWAFAAAGVIQDTSCKASAGRFKEFVSTVQLNSCCDTCLSASNFGTCNSGGWPAAALDWFAANNINTGGDYPDQTYGISSLMTAYHTDSQSGCIPYIYGGSGENHFDVDMGDTDSVYPCPTACWDGYTQYSMSDDLVGDEPVMTVERNIGFISGYTLYDMDGNVFLEQEDTYQFQDIYDWIQTHGSVIMTYEVFSDFTVSDGDSVYQKGATAISSGWHAVRVIGWGTNSEGVDYWLCVNSWNMNWGHEGTFKIIRGIDDCSTETYGFSGIKYECADGKILNSRGKCVDSDFCTDSPCGTGYTCSSGDSTHICTDIDECTDNTDDCTTGQSCTNTEGSFICSDIDYCENSPCGTGYTCSSGDSTHICTDIDECTDLTDDCTAGQSCTNTEGSFTCSDIDYCENSPCETGYTCSSGDSTHICTDVDECADSTDDCTTHHTCDNTEGSFTCTGVDYCAGDVCPSTTGYTCTNNYDTTEGFECTSTTIVCETDSCADFEDCTVDDFDGTQVLSCELQDSRCHTDDDCDTGNGETCMLNYCVVTCPSGGRRKRDDGGVECTSTTVVCETDSCADFEDCTVDDIDGTQVLSCNLQDARCHTDDDCDSGNGETCMLNYCVVTCPSGGRRKRAASCQTTDPCDSENNPCGSHEECSVVDDAAKCSLLAGMCNTADTDCGTDAVCESNTCLCPSGYNGDATVECFVDPCEAKSCPSYSECTQTEPGAEGECTLIEGKCYREGGKHVGCGQAAQCVQDTCKCKAGLTGDPFVKCT